MQVLEIQVSAQRGYCLYGLRGRRISRTKSHFPLTSNCVATCKHFELFNNTPVFTQVISKLLDPTVRKLASKNRRLRRPSYTLSVESSNTRFVYVYVSWRSLFTYNQCEHNTILKIQEHFNLPTTNIVTLLRDG